MIESRVETITPEMATQYLSFNTKNRSIRRQEVEAYARAIKSGAFVTTHQGIAFDDEGNLIDGQHRLMAIVSAGAPVQMMVTRGVPSNAMQIIDRGSSRTMRDVIALGEYGDDSKARMMRNTVMLSAMSQMVSCSYKRVKITSPEMLRLFEAFDQHAMTVYHCAVNKGVRKSQVISAALAALNCGVDAPAIVKFFQVFNKLDIKNCDGYNVQAALSWRRQMDDAKLQGMTMHRKRIYVGTQNAIWHFVNNTDATRVSSNGDARYDVKNVVMSALGV